MLDHKTQAHTSACACRHPQPVPQQLGRLELARLHTAMDAAKERGPIAPFRYAS